MSAEEKPMLKKQIERYFALECWIPERLEILDALEKSIKKWEKFWPEQAQTTPGRIALCVK